MRGRISATEDLGIILVLIPGGTIQLGSQKKDPKKPNYDPESRHNEGPIYEVGLTSYFLAKYEMTQGQWQRAFSFNPSYWETGKEEKRTNLKHPVESVSWYDVQKFLPRGRSSIADRGRMGTSSKGRPIRFGLVWNFQDRGVEENREHQRF